MRLWRLQSMVWNMLEIYIKHFLNADLYYMSKFEKGDEEEKEYSAFFRKCADAVADAFSTI